jgi:hypothetical protein
VVQWTESIRRAARKFASRRPAGVHPVLHWIALILTLVFFALLVFALIPRSNEYAASAIFYGALAGVFVAAALSWWAARTPRKWTRENPVLRKFLEERAVILASLISRGASEIAAIQGAWSEEQQLEARQQQNELLRHRGLWEHLEPTEQLLATSAQGTWSEEDAAMTYTWCEQLRMLRWVLGMDQSLKPLEETSGPDWDAVHQTLDAHFDPEHRRPMLAPWDVRIARDKAAEYTARVLAEYAHRGQIEDRDTDTASLLRWRDFVDGTARDLQVDQVPIADLDGETLQWVASISSVRWQYGAYLVDLLTDAETVSLADWEAAHMEDGAPVADGTRWQ